jgi:hypothetical protein
MCTLIETAMQRSEGLLIGRTGSVELGALLWKFSNGNKKPHDSVTKQLGLNAGIFPVPATFDMWYAETIQAMKHSDFLVVGWFKPHEAKEKMFLKAHQIRALQCNSLRALEPYYLQNGPHWTSFLRGQTVAVVSSCAKTCVEQVKQKHLVWPKHHETLVPDATYVPIVTGYAPELAKGRANWPSHVQTWSDAVAYCTKQVVDSGARFALIGCGGLGMILASKLKQHGIICIVLGGAIQVLFGIKGNRWSKHDVISKFWNDSWTWPTDAETPNLSNRIENACYWK